MASAVVSAAFNSASAAPASATRRTTIEQQPAPASLSVIVAAFALALATITVDAAAADVARRAFERRRAPSTEIKREQRTRKLCVATKRLKLRDSTGVAVQDLRRRRRRWA